MIQFFVYYNNASGAITAISPIASTDFPDCEVTRIDFQAGINFLNGTWDAHKWFVSSDGSLVESQFDLQPLNSDTLEPIQRDSLAYTVTSAIFVTVFTYDRILQVRVPHHSIGSEAAKNYFGKMEFVITERDNPDVVYDTVSVDVKEVFEKGLVDVPFTGTFKDCSVYTKKKFRFYQMNVKKSQSIITRTGRFNKMVEYKLVKRRKADTVSINVVHNINNHKLAVTLGDDIEYEDLGGDKVILYLTKPSDPTIPYHTVTLDSKLLNELRTLEVDLPENLKEFGVTGYPIVNNLTLQRK